VVSPAMTDVDKLFNAVAINYPLSQTIEFNTFNGSVNKLQIFIFNNVSNAIDPVWNRQAIPQLEWPSKNHASFFLTQNLWFDVNCDL
jgi:hypothetical protein